MKFILLLSFLTLIIIFLGWKIWKKTKCNNYLFGFFLIYFWTLNGAWIFTIDQLTGAKGAEIGISYYRIFEKLFPVQLDNNYFLTILYYGIFIILIQTVIWALSSNNKKINSNKIKPINISIKAFLILTIGLIILDLFIIYPDIKESITQSQSLYFQLNDSTNKFLTIYQLISKIIAFTSVFSLIIYFLEKTDNFFTFQKDKISSIVVISCLIFVVLFFIFTGNKHDLLFSGIFGMLYMLRKITLNRIKNFVSFSFILLVLFISIDLSRGEQLFSSKNTLQINNQTEISDEPKEDIQTRFKHFFFHNEMFYAHFSMYGVLSKNVPITYAKSFNYLAHSMIPRSIISERPENIYQYYANEVNAKKGQGYTIHHATAWYLNFGILGILLSAILLGGIWALLNNLFFRSGFKNNFLKLFAILSPFLFVAFLPNLIRNGPEAFKGVFLESLLLPVLIVYIATLVKKKHIKTN
ncbi:MAG: hypothetical protein JEY97_02950 [Bacteroidales bacterium]|nr:hypothetical protein [Bacteroidales bacterium]